MPARRSKKDVVAVKKPQPDSMIIHAETTTPTAPPPDASAAEEAIQVSTTSKAVVPRKKKARRTAASTTTVTDDHPIRTGLIRSFARHKDFGNVGMRVSAAPELINLVRRELLDYAQNLMEGMVRVRRASSCKRIAFDAEDVQEALVQQQSIPTNVAEAVC